MPPRLHEIMPEYHFNEVHHIDIDASPRRVWQALWAVDFNTSPVIKGLTTARGILRRRLGLEEFGQLFPIVYRADAEEVVMHATLKCCWGTLTIGWNFELEPLREGRTRLRTETRAHLPTRMDYGGFRLYWFFVEPFSRWIRRIMLRMVRSQCAERG